MNEFGYLTMWQQFEYAIDLGFYYKNAFWWQRCGFSLSAVYYVGCVEVPYKVCNFVAYFSFVKFVFVGKCGQQDVFFVEGCVNVWEEECCDFVY